MRILVIGGSGLISTAITRKLLDRGDEVVLFNRGQAEPPGLERANRILGDRYDPSGFTAAIRNAGTFDCVIDMICYEAKDARSLVEAVGGRTPHVIFCSTVDVYAKPASRYPVTESERRKPVNAYGRGKAESEDVLMSASNRDLRVTIIRPAHTYGPGGNHRGNFVHAFGSSTTFLDRLRRGKPVIVPGDGTTLRGSSHLDDVSAAFVNATTNPPDPFRGCHVTSEEWLTWNRYHQILAEALSAPEPNLVHIPTDVLARIAPKRAIRCSENYQFNGIYDNSAAHQELGYRYTISFAQGSRETIAWVARTGGFDNSDNDPFYDEVIAVWQEATGSLEHNLALRER
jgi:nucleoside-diphosphate-sugar epimerase